MGKVLTMKVKTNMKAIMYKKGIVDCMRGIPARMRNNPAYLSGYGRQYEREACNHG